MYFSKRELDQIEHIKAQVAILTERLDAIFERRQIADEHKVKRKAERKRNKMLKRMEEQ